MQEKEYSIPHAFLLPNGTPIKYAYPEDKGNQFKYFRSLETRRLLKNKSSKVKERSIKISCWNKSDQHLLFLDFDHLPKHLKSFDDLEHELKRYLGNKTVVARSSSNKVKALVVLDASNIAGFTLNHKLATLCMQRILPITLLPYVDMTLPALSLSFLTTSLFDALKQTQHLVPISVKNLIHLGFEEDKLPISDLDLLDTKYTKSLNSLGSISSNERSPLHPIAGEPARGKDLVEVRKWEGYVETPELDAVAKLVSWHKGDSKREKFIKVLLACHKLLDQGFDLPITCLSTHVGVSPRAIANWRNELEKLGWLRCICRRGIKGSKAYTYVAEGLFRETLQEVSKRFCNIFIGLPKEIVAGQWHEALWEHSRRFIRAPKDFINWAKSLSGINSKRRLRHAYLAIINRLKFANLPVPDEWQHFTRGKDQLLH